MTKRGALVLAMAMVLASGCDVVKVKEPEQPAIERDKPHNLGFEEGEPGDQIPGWHYKSETYAIEVVDDVRRSGKQSAHIRARPGQVLWGAFNQEYKGSVFAGKTVRVKAWIKVEDTQVCEECSKPNLDEAAMPEDPRRGAQIRVLGYGPSASTTETLVTPLVMGARDWTLFEATVQMPADIESAIIAPILWGPGKAWFDDLQVTTE
ncbi:MAG TPA: hypothetical protein VND22_06870 [Actinomycetota bacterium]|nr:hypothetical protein [Actinomycetota bacterium]